MPTNLNIKHIAFIMDGNRRWAEKNNQNSSQGHKAGIKTMGKIVDHCFKSLNISIVSVYAFSLDNWNRDPKEIEFLHNLIGEFYHKEFVKYKNEDIRVCVSGVSDFLTEETKNYIHKMEEETQKCQKGMLNICFNYSGRREIIEATKKICLDILNHKKSLQELDINSFKEYLFIDNILDVDLVIRTSGEMRISDFLLYQSAYAEYYVTDTYWPDFTVEELEKAVIDFSYRNRRFGGA